METFGRRDYVMQGISIERCKNCDGPLLVLEAEDEKPFAVGHIDGRDGINRLITLLERVRDGN